MITSIIINKKNKIPIFLQLAEGIENFIFDNETLKGFRLPSVTAMAEYYNISRDTVLQSYELLCEKGMVEARYRKGYYVKRRQRMTQHNIFLLFDELNSFKEDLYQSFIKNIGKKSRCDIFFHHYNLQQFKRLIEDENGNYSHYVIMPGNMSGTESSIAKLPDKKVYLLDQTNEKLKKYPAVFQNFKKIVYDGLVESFVHLKKYKSITLIYPKRIDYPSSLQEGFEAFCKDYKLLYQVYEHFEEVLIKKYHSYFIVNDNDLISFILATQKRKLIIGNEIGIITYNDHAFKQVVAGGITTISTDFTEMGRNIAQMLLLQKNEQVENPGKLILRKSL